MASVPLYNLITLTTIEEYSHHKLYRMITKIVQFCEGVTCNMA